MDWHRENTRDKKNYIKDIIITQGLEIRAQTKKIGVGTGRRGKTQEELTEGKAQNLKLTGDNCEE